jgi:prepilin-type N-terminal cleavage/methylation domain-containing protein
MTRHAPPPSSTRGAFTLIELLVSISIIALLLGLFLPALGSARETARTVACLSNQRQLGLAWSMYADHHNGRVMPLAYTDEADIGNDDGRFWWGTDGSRSGIIDHTQGLIAPYLDGWLGERSIFECPTQPRGTYTPQGSVLIPEHDRITSTYGYNGYYLSPAKTPGWSGMIGTKRWKCIADLANPADLLVFADTLLATSPTRPGRSTALLDPPMLYQGFGQWSPNPFPTTAFRHGPASSASASTGNSASAAAVAVHADGSARAHASRPEWILHPRQRIGSIGTTNDPHYVPDWSRW